MNAFYRSLIIILSSCMLFISCRPNVATPKPRGYARIDFPENKNYIPFDNPDFPYSFLYADIAKISQDTQLVKEENSPYWLNIDFPSYNATIYLSYKEIKEEQSFDQLLDESFRLSYKHDIKADFIHTPDFITENGLLGIYYEVGGNTASNYQFMLSDTTKHFLRGALYFDVTPNVDSIRPVLNYLKEDMEILIESMKFY
ncbi:MAG TPA: hypothetical protein VK027_01590 [Chitinophagaceae bacterium]|nr:hypothetical protein [Chitinophagaceae bacterium]